MSRLFLAFHPSTDDYWRINVNEKRQRDSAPLSELVIRVIGFHHLLHLYIQQ